MRPAGDGASELAGRKAALRLVARARRAALGEAFRRDAGDRIAEAVLDLPELAGRSVVAGYASTGSEVATGPLLARLRRAGHRTVLPRVEGSELVLVVVEDRTPLVRSRFGVGEPTGPPVQPPEDLLVLVPGLAFDGRGRRVGYGKGYYDRLLASLPGALAVGLAFETQVVDEVPCGPADVAVDLLVTEAGVRRTAPSAAPRRAPG